MGDAFSFLFFFLIVCFSFVLPAAGLILLALILRKQGILASQLEDLQEDLFSLTQAVNRLGSAKQIEVSGETKVSEERGKEALAEEATPEKIPPRPAAIPCVRPVSETARSPLVLSSAEQPNKSPAAESTVQPVLPPQVTSVSSKTAEKDARSGQPQAVPPKTAKQSPQANNLEAASFTLLNRLWNWFLFGSAKVPENTSLEYAIATNWLLRVGILIIVLCIGFFLKYSLEKNWIDDAGRCLLSVIVGLGMVGAGLKLKGKRFNLPGMGLLGGGLVTLYWSIYAAHILYALIPQGWALGAMILLTVCAGALAVWLNSPLVAIIGIVGGYGSPILMRLQEADPVAILVYMLVLGVGILGISFWRSWHLLSYLGLVFTYGLVLSLGSKFTSGNFFRVFPVLALFFMLYAAVMHIHNFIRRERSSLIELAGQVLNACVFFFLGGDLIEQFYSARWTAVLSLGLAAVYFVYLLVLLRSSRKDSGLEITLTGLSAFFLTLSAPILLSEDWLTVAWALQAAIMLWGAYKLKSQFLRSLAYFIYGMTFLRLLSLDLTRQFDWGYPNGSQNYWEALKDRFFVFICPVISLFAGFWIQKKPLLPLSATAPGRPETRPLSMRLFFWFGLLFSFFLLNLELNEFFQSLYSAGRAPGMTALWVGLLGYLIYRTAKGNSQVALPFLIIFGGLLICKSLFIDLLGWGFDPEAFTCGDIRYDATEAMMRGLNFTLITGLFLGTFFIMQRESTAQNKIMRTLFGYLGLATLFFYLTLELNTALGIYKEGFRAGAISILWSVFAFSFLLSGLQKEQRVLRYIGLALFAVIVGKVFLSDLEQLEPLYRIVAFGILGIIVTGGSFAYVFFRQSAETGELTPGVQ